MKIPDYPRYDRSKIIARKFMIDNNICWLPANPFLIAENNNWPVIKVSSLAKKINDTSEFIINNVIKSDDGAVLYCEKAKKEKYKIIYNEKRINGRIRWTIMHEIGHIVLNHLADYEKSTISRGLTDNEYDVLEKEADVFAAEILAPNIILNSLKIKDKKQLMNICKLTADAAKYRFFSLEQWRKWNAIDTLELKIKLMYKSFLSPITVCCRSNYKYNVKKNSMSKGTTTMNNKHFFARVNIENNKFDICPRCGNGDISSKANYCKICGLYLYNNCSNYEEPRYEECGITNSGDARYCENCGCETYLTKFGLLYTWEEVIELYGSIEGASEFEMQGVEPNIEVAATTEKEKICDKCGQPESLCDCLPF